MPVTSASAIYSEKTKMNSNGKHRRSQFAMTLPGKPKRNRAPLGSAATQNQGVLPVTPGVSVEDWSLVQEMIQGREDAWRRFINQYDSLILARVHATWREIGFHAIDGDVAAEISSEILIGLVDRRMNSLRSYRGRSRLSTWLCVITRRTTLRYAQRLMRENRVSDYELQHQVDPADELRVLRECQAHRIAILRVARSKLAPDDQSILKLFYEEELTYKQISTKLAISINSIGPKLERARKRLRRKAEEITSL